ncbi:hypothetical protein GSI_13399 [Ganoderma sinense ZZ0214-1]|uniref:Reverse transcriptase Ty1/copia-type domain-containing protein n=1 Tax=Ganoderma sinense ZZ0214-1 TaxID=1077348 RepID=A0A2G8RSR3_9APHY|nr:hypothetical protein GSI_13399 [Ganoderma sinense ZZ0214-1]
MDLGRCRELVGAISIFVLILLVVEQASKANQEHFGEPRSMSEVMALEPEERNKWLKAAQDELQSLVENGTFELVLLPSGHKAIGFRWVFWVKRNADGSIECYKCCLTSIRAILALAALKDLELESVDISSAYLNGELKEEVYMCQPDGFEEKTPQWVWRLCKALYGLKQAGRCWHEKLDKVLNQLGFEQLTCKHSVWVYLCDGVRLIIPVFVDDITIAGKDKAVIQRVKDNLRKHFKLQDLGPTSWLLGVQIKHDHSKCSLSISQRQYALDIVKRYGFSNYDPVSTHMDPGACLKPHTFLPAPCYIKGTLDYKLTYAPSPEPELFTSFTDADHAGCPNTGRSTSGYVIKMGTGAISWSSCLQALVAD